MMVSCPYCGNTFSIMSCTDGNYYCPTCHYYFKMITSTISDVATVPVPSNEANILVDTNPSKDFYYYSTEKYSKINLPKENKLDIYAKSITINENKMSITIDKDNIDKFDVIEINGVRFVKEDN